MSEAVPAIKDAEKAYSVPTAWRPLLAAVVQAIAEGDTRLRRGIPGAAEVSVDTASQIEAYLGDYGATLTELSAATWDTSVVQWMGDHLSVIVDLGTVEEEASDLVLDGTMCEVEGGIRFSLHALYVP